MKLKTPVQITLIITIGILAAIIFAFVFLSPSSQNKISVSGQSTIEATPDIITIYYLVESKGNTSKEAEESNSKIVNELIYQIVQLGFDKKDLKTQSFNIYPEYDWTSGNGELTGYKSSHSLKIKLSTDNSSKIGSLISAGANAGAGINYINFELSEELEQQYKAEAIKLASQDARIKAEAIAGGFNKKVGRVSSISVNDFGYYPWPIYNSAQMGKDIAIALEATSNIEPSEQSITAQVTAIYKIR